MAYAYQGKGGMRTARARVTGVNASYKDLCNVCRNVRSRPTEDAIEFLELAAIKKKAIWYARHSTGKGHRRELGGKIGGFPVKSVKFVLEVLKSASANAIRLGLGETSIVHIIANKTDTYPRMSPKGRRIRHNYEMAFIEVVLGEKQVKAEAKDGPKTRKAPDAKKVDAPKKAEEKKADAAKTNEAKTAVAAEAKKAEEKKASSASPGIVPAKS
ncbi:TPA: hypothetical protein HA243_00365 [Candidatus Micrarchaeota archaeon]|nr:hypothetical protein [Candidatus Micrarchaeota archaeon]